MSGLELGWEKLLHVHELLQPLNCFGKVPQASSYEKTLLKSYEQKISYSLGTYVHILQGASGTLVPIELLSQLKRDELAGVVKELFFSTFGIDYG